MDEKKVEQWIHQLNNNLGVILNSTEMMMQTEQLSPKALQRAKHIVESALKIRGIAVEIRDHLLG